MEYMDNQSRVPRASLCIRLTTTQPFIDARNPSLDVRVALNVTPSLTLTLTLTQILTLTLTRTQTIPPTLKVMVTNLDRVKFGFGYVPPRHTRTCLRTHTFSHRVQVRSLFRSIAHTQAYTHTGAQVDWSASGVRCTAKISKSKAWS